MPRSLFRAPDQILAQSITLALLAPTLALPTSYLAEGSLFEKKDGSVNWTGSHNAGGFTLTNLAAPSAASDAATKAYADALYNGAPYLGGADTVATSDVALTGLQTLNGYTLLANDVVMLVAQTDGTQNGPWIAAAGAWARPAYYPVGGNIREGSAIVIERGSFAGYEYILTTQGGATVNTTATTWMAIPATAAYTAGSGISITGNTIAVKNGSGLNFDGTNNLQVLANGGSLNVSGAGVKISDAAAPGQVMLGNASNAATFTTLSGDVSSVSGTGAVTLAASVRRLTNFVTGEVLGGALDGVNTTYTLANVPTAGTVALYYNGQRLNPGAGNDYTIASGTITTLFAPAGGVMTADYQK